MKTREELKEEFNQYTKFIAAKIRQLRIRQQLTQEDLSERTHLHSTFISRIERGEHAPRLESIFLLSKALGITPSRLLEVEDDEDGNIDYSKKLIELVNDLNEDSRKKIYKILTAILE